MKNGRSNQPCISIKFCTELSKVQVLQCEYRSETSIMSSVFANSYLTKIRRVIEKLEVVLTI